MPRAIVWIKLNDRVIGTIYIRGEVENLEVTPDVTYSMSKEFTLTVDATNYPGPKEEEPHL